MIKCCSAAVLQSETGKRFEAKSAAVEQMPEVEG